VYEHRQRAFSWHARSTKIIFWLSMFVAISGLVLAFWQFTTSVKEAERAVEENELTIKTELISLAFKSRSIAALILFLSVAYLTLYTLFIYPIREAGSIPDPETLTVKDNRAAAAGPGEKPKFEPTQEMLDAADNQPPGR
jgi:hypothetical protein